MIYNSELRTKNPDTMSGFFNLVKSLSLLETKLNAILIMYV